MHRRCGWLLLAVALSAPAARAADGAAPGVVVWLEPSLPSPDAQARVGHLTDGATAYAWGDYAFAPTPETDADDKRIGTVTGAVEIALSRWNDFDVEAGIAVQLARSVDPVSLVRSEADRAALLHALLLEGAATTRAFPEQRFATMEEAGPLRTEVDHHAVPRAWVDAIAIAPDAVWTRADLDDAAALTALQALQAELRALPRARLSIPGRPPGVSLVVDGKAVPADVEVVELLPGHHYVHALAGTRVAGRAELDLDAGQAASFPMQVTDQTLVEAHAAVLAGQRELPAALTAALESYRSVGGHTARLYLAVMDDKGRPQVTPYAGGAELVRPRPFTAMFAGDVGGGVVISDALDLHTGATTTALVAGPHLGVQMGIYNALLLGGASVYLAPTESFVWKADQNPNVAPVAILPYGGIGAYLPRPTSGLPLAQAAITYGALLPGSRGFGVTLGCGIPTQRDGAWTRITVDGYRGQEGSTSSAPDRITWAAILRVGFERLL